MKEGFTFAAAGERVLKGFPGSTSLFQLERRARVPAPEAFAAR